MSEQKKGECKNCGKRFNQEQHKTGRPKCLYCSDGCRVEYHRQQIHLRRLAAHEQKPEKICPNCGRRFREEFGRGHRQKFCSPKCKRQYHNRTIYDAEHVRMREADPACPHCGRQFQYSKEHGGRRQKYCCDECRLAYWKEHQYQIQHKVSRYVTCQHCGREFETCRGRARKFCNRDCYLKYLEGLREEVTCPVCGKVFVTSKKQRRTFCSMACMGIARTRLAMSQWTEIAPPRVEIRRDPGLLPQEAEPLEAPGLDESLWILPGSMLPKRIILVCQPLKFWNSWADYLSGHVQNELHMNPLSGDIFVFCNRGHTELRLLQWSGAGFELLSKKLGFGRFPWPKTADSMKEIEESDFRLLLEYPRFMMRLNEQRVPRKYIF